MVRRSGKVKLQFIIDRAERKRSQKKRVPVLVKKAREFSVLCDVPTCLVAYLSDEEQPVAWPSPEGAGSVLRRYKEAGESQRCKHKLDGPEFIGTLVEKAKAELAKVERLNRRNESNLLVSEFLNGRRGSIDALSPEGLASLGSMLENKQRTIDARLQEVSGGAIQPSPPAQLQLVQPAPAPPLMMAPLFSPNLSTPVLQDGGGLPCTDELQSFLAKAGIFNSAQPGPSSFNDFM